MFRVSAFGVLGSRALGFYGFIRDSVLDFLYTGFGSVKPTSGLRGRS